MRRRKPQEEPLTINGDVIAKYLEDRGCPQMAAFVRILSQKCQEANQREAMLAEKYNDVVRQLWKYEPPPQRVDVSYRSEWD